MDHPTKTHTRIRDAAQTRAAILMAAQKLFSHKGYASTGVRDIAEEAGISFALVRRYFGSKQGLLRAALEDILRVEPLIAGDRESFGKRAVALFDMAPRHNVPVAMMLLAGSDSTARQLCSELLQERILTPLARWLGEPDGHHRAARLQVVWSGYIAAQQILALRQLQEPFIADNRRWIAELTQAIADGRSPMSDPGSGEQGLSTHFKVDSI